MFNNNNYNNFNNNHHVPTLDGFRKFCEPFDCNQMFTFYKYIEIIRQEKFQNFQQYYNNYCRLNYSRLNEIDKLNNETEKILAFKNPNYHLSKEYECIKEFYNFFLPYKSSNTSIYPIQIHVIDIAGIKNEREIEYKIPQIMNECRNLNRQQKQTHSYGEYLEEEKLKQNLQNLRDNLLDRLNYIDKYRFEHSYRFSNSLINAYDNIKHLLNGTLSKRKKLGLDGITDFTIIERKIDQVISNIEDKIKCNNYPINNYNNNRNYQRFNNNLNNYERGNYRPINYDNALYNNYRNNRIGHNQYYNNF